MQAATRSIQTVRLCHGEARDTTLSWGTAQTPRFANTRPCARTPSSHLHIPASLASSCSPTPGSSSSTASEKGVMNATSSQHSSRLLEHPEEQMTCRGSTVRASSIAEAPLDLEPRPPPGISINGTATRGDSETPKLQKAKSGSILEPCYTINQSTNIMWHETMTSRPDREALLGQKGCVIWITGLSGSGKSTLAYTLDHALNKMGRLSYVLDGDNVRHGLCNDLNFCSTDRAENNRRVAEVAKLFADCGVITIVSFISPYIKDRENCRKLLGPGEFIEVYLKASVEVCEKRDPKGLYKKARAGVIKGFTGVDDPYEEPPNPEVKLNAGSMSPEEMASHLLQYLEARGMLQPYCK